MTKKTYQEILQAKNVKHISRRNFLRAAGLGAAGSVLAACTPKAAENTSDVANEQTSVDLGDELVLATWPNYHNEANFENFTKATGVNIKVNAFGSNEEMLAKLQAGGTGWDVFVPTNYVIADYVAGDLIEKLDMSLLPNFDESASSEKFLNTMRTPGEADLWVVPKNWGTTGFVYNTNRNLRRYHELEAIP